MIIHFINSYTFVTGKPFQVVNPVNYSPVKTIGLNKGRSQVLRAVLEIREKKRVPPRSRCIWITSRAMILNKDHF
ncbi:unnamed protein product [Brassica oleracea]